MLDLAGKAAPAVYSFERTVNGELLVAVIHVYDPDDPIALTVVRSTLAALRIEFDPGESI